MGKYTYTFNIINFIHKALYCFLFSILCISCKGAGKYASNASYDYYYIVPQCKDNKNDNRWATYLIEHLNRRSGMQNIASSNKPRQGTYLQINLEINTKLPTNYSIKTAENNNLTLKAQNNQTMLWLVYQLIEQLALKDTRIDITDLPPAQIPAKEFENSEGQFAFEYRGIYTPTNCDPERMSLLNAHNVDYDWGLWGHNLHKVFVDGIPKEAQASINGEKNGEQFCFSSKALYKAVENYIIDNYGEGAENEEKIRFAIFPNDNDLVCTCPTCTQTGNTPKSATPTVTAFLEQIAKRFPHHIFFTSSYITTTKAPTHILPSNTGVLISSIKLPICPNFSKTPQAKRFNKQITEWKKVTSHIYVWDYMRNFDDYLTPYPCLKILQERLQYFHKLGITGIFYNGSGDDYASFDDMQTYVLATMLINPDAPIEQHITTYLNHFYPQTSELLIDNYLTWERTVQERNAQLPYYGGINDAVKAWLEPEKFETFCGLLDKQSKNTNEAERVRLNRLLTALQFTRLELMRMPQGKYDLDEIDNCLESLAGHTNFKDMVVYREANGKIEDYLHAWETLKEDNAQTSNWPENVEVRSISRPDVRYTELSILTDGRYALPTDYHTGWIIASPQEVQWEIPGKAIRSGATLTFSFLSAPRWRIYLPQTIEIWQNGKQITSVNIPEQNKNKDNYTKHRIKCQLETINSTLPIEIHIKQAKGNRPTLACDEIEIKYPDEYER